MYCKFLLRDLVLFGTFINYFTLMAPLCFFFFILDQIKSGNNHSTRCMIPFIRENGTLYGIDKKCCHLKCLLFKILASQFICFVFLHHPEGFSKNTS